MIVLIALLVAGLVAALLVGVRSFVGTAAPTVADEQRWLVDHAPAWLAGTMRAIDRRVIGGAAAGVACLVIFSAAAAVGWIFSGLDDARGFARWDVAAAEFGRDNATDASTRILGAITELGGTVLLVVVMVLLGVYQAVRHSDSGPIWYLSAVGVGVVVLNNGLKLAIDRERPHIAQLAGHAGSSFPSGHSAAAAACWAAIALVLARQWRCGLRTWTCGLRTTAAFVAVFIASAVAATRVLLGVHWLTDVIAGLVVGWAWFGVITIVFGGSSLRLGEPARSLTPDPPELDGDDEFDSIGRRIPASFGDERRGS